MVAQPCKGLAGDESGVAAGDAGTHRLCAIATAAQRLEQMGSGGSNAVVATAGHWYRGQQPVVSTEGSTSILICCPSSAAVPVWDVPVPSADRRRLHQLRGSSATARGWMYWMRPARGCRVSRFSLSLSAHIPAVSLQSHSTHARVIIEMVHISIHVLYGTIRAFESQQLQPVQAARPRGRACIISCAVGDVDGETGRPGGGAAAGLARDQVYN